MRISDWSSDVCSSDLALGDALKLAQPGAKIDILVVDAKASTKGHGSEPGADIARNLSRHGFDVTVHALSSEGENQSAVLVDFARRHRADLLVIGASAHSRLRELFLGGVTHDLIDGAPLPVRSEEHTSELQSLMRTSSA